MGRVMDMFGRLVSLMFHDQMGDCDYFEYNGREFCITGHVSHILFFPLRAQNALMRMPVNLFGVFGGIDVSHIPGTRERCILWARRRAYTTWAAVLFLLFGILLLTGVVGAGAWVGTILMVPGVLSVGAALAVYAIKPKAPETCIEVYKELLQPLFPESDLPNLEPTALEAVTTLLHGKKPLNNLGKALKEEEVNPSEVMDSCLLVHPCIAAGNHGSMSPSTDNPPSMESPSSTDNPSTEPRDSGQYRRPLLEGKLEAPDTIQAPLDVKKESEDEGKSTTVQISPLARMLESIPEPQEVVSLPAGSNAQFCVTADEQDENQTDDQWRSVASTLDKFLGPKATILGRAVLPPETALRSERGSDVMFLENTPVHDDSHVVYIETPSSRKSSKQGGILKGVQKKIGNMMGKTKSSY